MWTNERTYVDIVMALDRALGPMGRNIGVSVEHGVARLTGHVCTAEQKGAAERAVATVRGVRAIVGSLRVIGEPVSTLDDTRLAQAVLAALDHVDAGAEITVLVEGGWVRLGGVVPTEAACEAIERALDSVPGIQGVVSEVRVVPDGPYARGCARVA